MRQNARFRGDFDIDSGVWVSGGGQPSDVAIHAWELVIPCGPAPPLVLVRFTVKV